MKGYDGGDICLNSEKDIWLKKDEHPELAPYVGDDIFVSDGTSVLGADNKSGVAVVMEALSTVTRENLPHGDIYIAFVPDEEIGLKGSKKLNLSKFPVDLAYTVDGGELGEVVYETFNAAEAVVTIRGISAHPMNSKGFLVNPVPNAPKDARALFTRSPLSPGPPMPSSVLTYATTTKRALKKKKRS